MFFLSLLRFICRNGSCIILETGAYAGRFGALFIADSEVLLMTLMYGTCWCHLLLVFHYVSPQIKVLLLMLLRGACHKSRDPSLMKKIDRLHFRVVTGQRMLTFR
jgi:hypothetical protein